MADINKGMDKQPENTRDPYSAFKAELERLINRHSLESRTDTPDFILAEYMIESLRALEHQHYAKKAWHTLDDKNAPTSV